MESVTMTVTNEDVTSIRYINTIREISDRISANPPLELPVVIENNDTVTL